MSSITHYTPAALEAAQLEAEADALSRSALSPATLRAYTSDWRAFTAWCGGLQYPSLPAEAGILRRYVALLSGQGKAPATILRKLAAIDYAHKLAGMDPPRRTIELETTIRGMIRRHGKPPRQAAALPLEHLQRMVGMMGESLVDLRDAALLLVGFAGAFRRSELVALDVADVELQSAGVVLHIRRSKTDQEGHGQVVALPYGRNPETCPVTALRAWLEVADIQEGPIFRSFDLSGVLSARRLPDQDVSRILKRRAEAAGLDASRLSGHSLRAGLATAAARAGVEERTIQKQTRHKDSRVLRRYIRDGELFRDNAASALDL